MRALTRPIDVTDVVKGTVMVSQGAVVQADGSHRWTVNAIRTSAASVWLTSSNGIETRTDRYRKADKVTVERAENTATLTGKPTTSGEVRYRVPNVYGHRR